MLEFLQTAERRRPWTASGKQLVVYTVFTHYTLLTEVGEKKIPECPFNQNVSLMRHVKRGLPNVQEKDLLNCILRWSTRTGINGLKTNNCCLDNWGLQNGISLTELLQSKRSETVKENAACKVNCIKADVCHWLKKAKSVESDLKKLLLLTRGYHSWTQKNK